jgi:cellulose synthase operon protein C
MTRDSGSGGLSDGSMEQLLDELEQESASSPVPASRSTRPRPSVPPPLPPPARRPSARPPTRPSTRPPAPPLAAAPRPRAAPPATPKGGFGALADHARELIRACEQELTSHPEPRRAARLHYEVARLYESVLCDARRAAAHYQEALRHNPEHVPTLRGARRAALSRNDARAALPLFDAEARLVADPRRRAALHLAKGRLLEDVLGRKAEAREAYATAYELDRSNTACLKALEQASEDAGDWDAQGRILERAANAVASDPSHRAALIVARARTLETRKGDVEGAIELYETALRLDPRVSGALGALKRLHHQHQRHQDLIRVLGVELEHATDPQRRAMVLYRIGRLHLDRLGNRREALAAFERALAEAPDEVLVLSELCTLYEQSERWDDQVQALGRLADVATQGEERAHLLHRMGAIHEEHHKDPAAAVASYEAALEEVADHLPTLQALGRLYAAQERPEELARLHAHEAAHAPEPERRAAAHVRAAEVLEHSLDRPEEAAEHHARALAAVPGHAPAFKALARLYEESGQWRPLVDLYERAIEQGGRRTMILAHLFKVAALHEDALGDSAMAARTYRRVLALDPHDMRAIHALQRTTERAGQWEAHVAALEMECREVEEAKVKVPLLHRMGEVLYEHLGDWDGAVARLREALALQPSHRGTLATLGRLYHAAGRWEDLLDVYERELTLLTEDRKKVPLLRKMGALCSGRIGRDGAAVTYYQRLLALDPTHGEAVRALGHLLHERGDHAALAAALEGRLKALPDPTEQARTAYRLGEVVEEHLHDVPRALRAYRRALEGMPGHRAAHDAVARLRAAQKAWKDLAEGLEGDAATVEDTDLAVELLVQAGEVWADRVGDATRAIRCYEAARQRAPHNLGVWLALERLHRRAGNHRALAEVHAAQARVMGDDGARSTALRELVRVQTVHGVGTDEEIRLASQALLELSPGDPVALEVLEGQALAEGDLRALTLVDGQLGASLEDPAERAAHYTRLGEALEARGEHAAFEAYRMALTEDPESIAATRGLSRIASRLNDPIALAEAARREARVSRDGSTAAALLVKSGVLRMERLGDFEGAIADFERALELHADHEEAAHRLDALLTQEDQPQRLCEALSRAATAAAGPSRVAALWSRVAALQADSLGQVGAAIGALNRVLRATPDDVQAMRRLADLYAQDGQWNEAVHLLQRLLTLGPDGDTLRHVHLQLATLYDEHMGDPARALVSLKAVLALDPTQGEALRRLATAHLTQGDNASAREAATRLADTAPTDPARAAALFLLAHIEQRGQRPTQARRALHEAVTLEGPRGEAAMALRRSLRRPDEWQIYVQAIREHIGRRSDPPPEAFLEIAEVQAERLGQQAGAVRTLEEGLRETGGDVALRRALAAHLQAAGEHGRAAEQLQRLVHRDPASSAAWRDLARVHAEAGRPHATRNACEALVVLEALDDTARPWLEAAPPRSGAVRRDALDAATLRALCGLAPHEARAADVLAHVAPALGKLYPADLEVYGLSLRDRIGRGTGHPLRELVDRLAGAFGDVSFDLLVHRVRGRGVCVELGDPPILLVPAALLDAPLPRQVFLLARPLVHMAQRFEAIDKLTPREIQVVLAAATRRRHPGYGAGLTNEEVLSSMGRRIHRALPWRGRGAVRRAAEAYVEAPRTSFAPFCEILQRTATHVAALMADDLPAVVDALRTGEGTEASGPDLVRGVPSVAQLMRFWTSDEAASLRTRLGLGD